MTSLNGRRWAALLVCGLVLPLIAACTKPTLTGLDLRKGGTLDLRLVGVMTENKTRGDEDSWAVGSVMDIRDGFNVLWSAGRGEERLNYILYGINHLSTYFDETWNEAQIFSVGAANGDGADGKIHLDIYLTSSRPRGTSAPSVSPDLSGGPKKRTGFGTYPTVTEGELVLSLELVPGIVEDDPQTGVDESTTTLYQTATSVSLPSSGVGVFYANVTGGSLANFFNTNKFPTLLDTYADVRGEFSYMPARTGAPNYGCSDPPSTSPKCWENFINDPIQVHYRRFRW